MDITIDTKKIFAEFDAHLANEQNERILFSSAFGTGKSTFLSEYFNDRAGYNVFKIYPVSYSVANNEDIFELIKYDVLFQLFERAEEGQLHLINEDYSQILAYQFKFLTQADYSPILYRLLELADKTGKYSAIEKVVEETRKQYHKFKAEHKDEEELIFQFLYQQYSKKGSPKENDLVSQLIRDLLMRLKISDGEISDDTAVADGSHLCAQDSAPSDTAEPEIENVLIIDDLDRLDPEHIFRLFNVFSVNFGCSEVENKFGFDKIIFVCDLENIRKIYAHRYGEGVDFGGYINKFYSTTPFLFDTNQFLAQYLSEILEGFNFTEEVIGFSDAGESRSSNTFLILRTVLLDLITQKKVNLRKLLYADVGTFSNKPFGFTAAERFLPSQFPVLVLFHTLKMLFDSVGEVERVLNEMVHTFDKNTFGTFSKAVPANNATTKLVMEAAVPFLIDHQKLNSETNDMGHKAVKDLTVKAIGFELNIDIKVEVNHDRSMEKKISLNHFLDIGGNQVEVNPYDILLAAYHNSKKILVV